MVNKDICLLVGKNVKKYRATKAWSQEKLYDKSGITPVYISLIERGLSNPSVRTLDKISEALGVPIFLLFM